MTLELIFAWYDLWVGAYWDRTHRRLYVLPVPCVGFVIQFARSTRKIITKGPDVQATGIRVPDEAVAAAMEALISDAVKKET